MSNSTKKPYVNNAAGVNSQKSWKQDYNRIDRRTATQVLNQVHSQEDQELVDELLISDIKKTPAGDIWLSPSDGNHLADDDKYKRK